MNLIGSCFSVLNRYPDFAAMPGAIAMENHSPRQALNVVFPAVGCSGGRHRKTGSCLTGGVPVEQI